MGEDCFKPLLQPGALNGFGQLFGQKHDPWGDFFLFFSLTNCDSIAKFLGTYLEGLFFITHMVCPGSYFFITLY